MQWLNKFEVGRCSICVLFFDIHQCHVSLTSRDPNIYIRTLKRQFSLKGFELIESESFDVGCLNYWDRVSEKYMWRYLMHSAGFKIVNQDGSFFDRVEDETRDTIKIDATKKLLQIKVKPANSIIRAEYKSRKRRFLPKQVINRLILKNNSEQRAYSNFEKRLLGLTTIFQNP